MVRARGTDSARLINVIETKAISDLEGIKDIHLQEEEEIANETEGNESKGTEPN